MPVYALVFQAIGHLVEEHDAQASGRPFIGRHGEVCGRVGCRIKGLAIIVNGQHQLVVVSLRMKFDGSGLPMIDNVCHCFLYG